MRTKYIVEDPGTLVLSNYVQFFDQSAEYPGVAEPGIFGLLSVTDEYIEYSDLVAQLDAFYIAYVEDLRKPHVLIVLDTLTQTNLLLVFHIESWKIVKSALEDQLSDQELTPAFRFYGSAADETPEPGFTIQSKFQQVKDNITYELGSDYLHVVCPYMCRCSGDILGEITEEVPTQADDFLTYATGGYLYYRPIDYSKIIDIGQVYENTYTEWTTTGSRGTWKLH